MQAISLLIIVVGNFILASVAWIYLRRFREVTIKHSREVEKREIELRRHVLELQVLRSLAERTGYNLDLRQILEVIIDNIDGLVDYSTISYILPLKDNKILSKIHAREAVSHLFLAQVKNQALTAFSASTGQNLQFMPVEEIISGTTCDDTKNFTVESSVSFPITIGSQIKAIILIASVKQNLYKDEGTAILAAIFNQMSAQISKLSQSIENEKRRLSVAVSSAVDGIMMVDSNFNLIITNPVLPKLLGLPGEIGSFLDIVAAVGTQADLKQAIERSFTTKNPVKLAPCVIGGKDIQIDVEPVYDKDQFGYFLGVAVVFHDLAATRQMDNLREEFTAMMIHELRTPLTTITYSTDMMLSDLNDLNQDEIRQQLQIIKATTDNMLSLVSELLDVAKIEAGRFVVVKEAGNLNGLLEEKVTAFKPLTDQKKLNLSFIADPHLNSFVFDRNRIGEVVDNLLSNAIKYTDQGQISISSQQQDHQVIVTITDTGDGIDPHDLPKLFSKFEQLGKGKTGDKMGTGLGLVIAKGIVEAHGGRIWAQSDGLGKGSTFTFSLPLT